MEETEGIDKVLRTPNLINGIVFIPSSSENHKINRAVVGLNGSLYRGFTNRDLKAHLALDITVISPRL